MKIILLSTSEVKLKAVMLLLGATHQIVAIECPESIPVQPEGYGTQEAGFHRLVSLQTLSADMLSDSIIISIQNALRYDEDKQLHYDFVCVVVTIGTETLAYEKHCCVVPERVVNNRKNNETWGQAAVRLGLAKDHTNPHQEECFGGISRDLLIMQALQACLEKFPRIHETARGILELFQRQYDSYKKTKDELPINKSSKYNVQQALRITPTEQTINALFRHDKKIKGLPRFISDLLDLQPSRHREMLVKHPALIKQTLDKLYLIMPNPTLSDHQLMMDSPKQCKFQRAGFGLIAWYIHPLLLVNSKFSKKEEVLSQIVSSEESLRYGKYKTREGLQQCLPRAESLSELLERAEEQLSVKEIVAKSSIPYLSGPFDLSVADLESLKELRQQVYEHLWQNYGIDENDRVLLYFHTHYSLETTTLHLHIRINQVLHPLELDKSIFLEEIIDCLENDGNVATFFMERQPVMHLLPSQMELLVRMEIPFTEVNNPYYLPSPEAQSIASSSAILFSKKPVTNHVPLNSNQSITRSGHLPGL